MRNQSVGGRMDQLRKIIEEKKRKGEEKKPRYGMRKLSVGVVSCMLGYFLFFAAPMVANAAEIEPEDANIIQMQSVEDTEGISDNQEVTEDVQISNSLETVDMNSDVDDTDSAEIKEEGNLEETKQEVAEDESLTTAEEAESESLTTAEAVENEESETFTLTYPSEKIWVADPSNLTAEEQAAVEQAVRGANPNLPADATLTVAKDGTVTIVLKNGQIFTIGQETVIQQARPVEFRSVGNNAVEARTMATNKEKVAIENKVEGMSDDEVALHNSLASGVRMVQKDTYSNDNTPVPVLASTRSINNEVYYEIKGEVEDRNALNYSVADFDREDDKGIHLNVSKWAGKSNVWGYTEKGSYNGRFLLNFFDDEFYTKIESVTVNGESFEKEADGALWKVPINAKTFSSGIIGAVTNHDVVIRMQSGKSLEQLGLQDKKIDFITKWINQDNIALASGNAQGYILINNPDKPAEPADPRQGSEDYIKAGMDGLYIDGSKDGRDGNFTEGNMGKRVEYDGRKKEIYSTVTWKPGQNFMQSNSGWVLYINEKIPVELVKYIDENKVYLYASDIYGNIGADNTVSKEIIPIKLKFNPNSEGLFSTKDTDEISIVGKDWNKVAEVRKKLNENVFYGTLGQSRSFTIKYGLKDDVNNNEFAEALNKYINANNSNLRFASWLTADFVDETNLVKPTRHPDGGAENKRLQKSYSNAFLEVFDTDKDGLYDFVEEEIGSNPDNVDTDGDGVPDNVEFLDDKTNLTDATSYQVAEATPITKIIKAKTGGTIEGKAPKIQHKNPAHEDSILKATDTRAGGVMVKAYKYEEGKTDYTNDTEKASVTIPFDKLDSGAFSIAISGNDFQAGDKIILVTYSPDGKKSVIATELVEVVKNLEFDVESAPNVIEGQNVDWDQKIVHKKSGGEDINISTPKQANGLSINAEGKLEGNPQIGDWNKNEENRVVEISVKVSSKDYSEEKTVKVPVTVQRDTDGDGEPDITDPDDDGDKIPDVEEIDKGSKDYSEEKTVKVPVTVQRDTDGDGEPDITDPDDDGDKIPDVEEIDKGSDPKDPNSIPQMNTKPGKPDKTPEAKPESPKNNVAGNKANISHKNATSDPKDPNSIPQMNTKPGKPDKTPEAKPESPKNNVAGNKANISHKNATTSTPKTGDFSNVSGYAGLAALAGGLLVLLGIKKRKEEEEASEE